MMKDVSLWRILYCICKKTLFCQNFRFVFHKSSSVAMTEREGNRVKEDRRSLIPIMGRRLERERDKRNPVKGEGRKTAPFLLASTGSRVIPMLE